MTPFSLYNASLAAAEKYRQAEDELNAFVECEKPLGRIYTSWDEQMTILKQHRALITARDKAKKEFEKADKEWKREWAKNNNNKEKQ